MVEFFFFTPTKNPLFSEALPRIFYNLVKEIAVKLSPFFIYSSNQIVNIYDSLLSIHLHYL